MANAFERQIRLERRYLTASFALTYLRPRAERDATILRPAGLSPRDVTNTLLDLEAVYTVRLFSEFEATLRSVAKSIWPRHHSAGRTVTILINRISARHHVVNDASEDAHEVRRFEMQSFTVPMEFA
jgi:hypothetical protein